MEIVSRENVCLIMDACIIEAHASCKITYFFQNKITNVNQNKVSFYVINKNENINLMVVGGIIWGALQLFF